MFHNDEISDNGIYAVNVYALGMPHTVVIDDYLPFMPHPRNPDIHKLSYAFLGSENAIWGPLLEKALAKFTGNYWHLEGGMIYDGVSMLNGSPFETIVHQPYARSRDVDQYWNTLRRHDNDRSIITCKSSKSAKRSYGGKVKEDHSFAIIKTVTLSNGERILKVRNPWGRELWDGNYSDKSRMWTDKLKSETDWVDADDGDFYMSVEDLYSRMESTFVNYDTQDWSLGYFAMFEDPGTQNGRDLSCGATCTRHRLQVTSEVDQDIWIGAHTWQYYGYGQSDQCPSPSQAE